MTETEAKSIAELAKQLADCKARVLAYGMTNALGRSYEETLRSGALMELATTALEKAQREYDEAVAKLSVEEIDQIGRILGTR